MNVKMLCKITSKLVLLEGAALLLPLLVCFIYSENAAAKHFTAAIAVCAAAGGAGLIAGRKAQSRLKTRDGFLAVALGWFVLSLIGAIPFLSEKLSFTNAFFETVSGFTTTGASVIADLSRVSHGLLFWRSLTNWIGGMGVLVLFIALLPQMGGSIQLFRAESPGPVSGKLVPRLRESGRILYIIYIGITLLELCALLLAKMPFFDALNHTLATAGTGGFSTANGSVGAYSPAVTIIIGVFMLLFGVNFAVYFALLRRKLGDIASNSELKVYLSIAAVSTLLVALNIRHLYPEFKQALTHGFFQASSVLTSTGFQSADYNAWPEFSRMVLFVLMITGGCAGSTAGGIKISRVVLAFKGIYREVQKIIYPNVVRVVRSDGKSVSNETLHGVMYFFSAYFIIAVLCSVVVGLDNKPFGSSFSAVLSCLSNTGINVMGHYIDWSSFGGASKMVMSFCMVLGRLEIFPVLVLLAPASWRKV